MPLTRRKLTPYVVVLLLFILGVMTILMPAVHRARVAAQRSSDQ